MAERRMFANKVVSSDAFLALPLTAQALYFHLNMWARDGGLLNNTRTITKYISADFSDLRALIQNGFLTEEEDSWYRIAHWDENNGIGENAKKRKTPNYRKWRRDVIERDKVCQMCGTDQKLEAHHIKPFAKFPELRFSLENGITLCKSCHRQHHKQERERHDDETY